MCLLNLKPFAFLLVERLVVGNLFDQLSHLFSECPRNDLARHFLILDGIMQ